MSDVPALVKIETRTGNRKPKGRRSAPKTEERRITKSTGNSFEYKFKDPQVGELMVLATENGWWKGELGRVKLQQIIDAWKIDANDDEAAFAAGITRDQMQYFHELHPELYGIKDRCRQNLGLRAKVQFAKQVESGEMSYTYLRLKRKDEGYNPRTEVVSMTDRELIEQESKKLKELGERVRSRAIAFYKNGQDIYVNPNQNQGDAGVQNNDADAGSDGPGNEASPA